MSNIDTMEKPFPSNTMEYDSIAFCAMDVTFAIFNFVIAYKLLINCCHFINKNVQIILILIYVFIVLQAIVSMIMVYLVYLFRDSKPFQILV